MAKDQATHLKVQLDREGEKRVVLRLPATAVQDLAVLVPADFHVGHGIDAPELGRRARQIAARGYPPGDVVHVSSERARLRIWLE